MTIRSFNLSSSLCFVFLGLYVCAQPFYLKSNVGQCFHYNNVLFQVLAWDDDEAENGRLTFDIRKVKDDSRIFEINPDTGMIVATDDLNAGDVHHLVVGGLNLIIEKVF